MNCPNCNKELKPGAKFCVFCGTKVAEPVTNVSEKDNVCPKCNKELRPGAKFCTSCGYKLDSANVDNNEKKSEIKKRVSQNVTSSFFVFILRSRNQSRIRHRHPKNIPV